MKQQSFSSSPLPFGPKTLVIGAGALAAFGLTRRSTTTTLLAAAGGVLAYMASRPQPRASQDETRSTFLVNASPEQAYGLWRNFENLPRFMAHLSSVRSGEGGRSEWVANGLLGREVRWTAEMVADEPNQRIAWQSVAGSDVQTSGSVQFRADPLNRGTYVTARVQYSLPGGSFGSGLATLFGKHPEFVVREDLRRFKALLEAGEVPTTKGQPNGPRGIHGTAEQHLFREPSNQPEPQAAQSLRQSA